MKNLAKNNQIKKLPMKFTLENCEVSVCAEQDDTTAIEGSFATGDDEADEATRESIRNRLENGHAWAWAFVTVTVTPVGVYIPDRFSALLTGRDTLGACSYDNEADFRRSDYFKDMRDLALADLNLKVGALREIL